MQWIKNLNLLDYKKATRAFYSEINRKNRKEEYIGPIVSRDGKISKTQKERLENWRNYYKELYSPSKEEEMEDEDQLEESMNEAKNEPKKIRKEHEGTLDREITIEEIVDALFALKSDTAAGKEAILIKDLIQLLEKNLASGTGKTWKY